MQLNVHNFIILGDLARRLIAIAVDNTSALRPPVSLAAFSGRNSGERGWNCRTISCLHVHSAPASVQELRPSALRSELAYRALRVLDSSPLAGSGSLSKNFLSWQRGYAATWEQRTFESVTELFFKQV